MKKLSTLLLIISLNTVCSAQKMIVGKDTISLADFKKENLYGLENSGVAKTVKTTQDFYLLQQFAEEKRADTTATFRNAIAQKEMELREKLFLPVAVTDPLLSQYINDSKIERKVLLFLKQITPEDKTDYTALYNDVKSGKISMEDAISKNTGTSGKAFYVKPGTIDNDIYAEIKKLSNNSFTKLFKTSDLVAFAQLLETRPSLGYMVFGTISYPNNSTAAKMKADIQSALQSGKKFPEVAKLYGSTDEEKNNGGLVIGSPTLPDDVYAIIKNKKAGEFTEPILIGDKFFIFNVYSVTPYELTEKSKPLFKSEMMKSLYGDLVQTKLVDYLRLQPNYKESAEYKNAQKSYAAFMAEGKGNASLFSFNSQKFTVDELRKLLTDKVKDADKLNPVDWKELLNLINAQFVFNAYAQDFTLREDVKPELMSARRNLYSEFIFSTWLTNEIQNHPEWLSKFYNENKSKFIWESRAEGRVAILNDATLTKEIVKEISDKKNWETLQKKYDSKTDAKNQALINFESGEMSETADVFKKYNVPFKKGVHSTKMGTKNLVIAIDNILQPSQMTEKESEEYLRDGVAEQQLNAIISAQRAKTKISVDPEFLKDLEKNFKK